ncbi:GNAT family N-acetyltransferase [Neorhizobium sp. T786]|uniref:GNAT family N-acetyltransferase n=1 Tax=Pseudorhizobium xiangyangii TaxID=2883104 RepID=UPI001CFFA5F5|nr:GNAT family N-acetyltransferase [Neorhizobium xiangyangii]MCB5204684.1 GNAT family N-acetyltransferase [Neorhizobium xiangyangii]
MLPTFETERLLLRPRTMGDFDACLAMDCDLEVTKFILGPWLNSAEHESFLKQRIQHPYGRGLGYWSIFPKHNSDEFMGWVLLTPEDVTAPEIEIGWRLNRKAWGKGYATEAALPILNHAFKTVGINRVIADIDPHNSASIRVAEKIGMRPLQAGRMVITAPGREKDLPILMAT